MRKIDGAEISRDKIVIGITEKAGQDLGRQNSNHCYPKTDMARKDQRQKEAGRTNDIVGFIVKQLVAAFFFFHIHTLSSILKTIHPYSQALVEKEPAVCKKIKDQHNVEAEKIFLRIDRASVNQFLTT